MPAPRACSRRVVCCKEMGMGEDALDVIYVPAEDLTVFVPHEEPCVLLVPADNEVIFVSRVDDVNST